MRLFLSTIPGSRHARSSAAAIVLVLCHFCQARAQVDVAWNSTSGLFPNELCPFALVDTAEPEDPHLTGQILHIETSDDLEAMFYDQQGDSLIIPSLLIIEARLKVISETHQVGPRRGVAIGFTVEPNRGNVLMIGVDEVFLWSSYAVGGPVALVDTDSALHTYRIEVADQSAVSIYYDGELISTGSIITDAQFSDRPVIFFGDGTGNATGVSDWFGFSHNASALPCDVTPSDASDDFTFTTWGRVKSTYYSGAR